MSDTHLLHVIRDERWYDDGSPPFWKGRESAKQRVRRARRIASELRRQSGWHFAHKLLGCRMCNRCGSLACPHCSGAVQRWLVDYVLGLVPNPIGRLVMVTIVPPNHATAKGALTRKRLRELKTYVVQVLDAAGLAAAPFVGAADISLNVYPANGLTAPSPKTARSDNAVYRSAPIVWSEWHPHWCLFTWDRDARSITAALRKVIPRSDQHPRPVYSKLLTHNAEYMISYSYKTRFNERCTDQRGTVSTSFIDQYHFAHRELFEFLDTLKFQDRLFFKNVHI